MKTKEQERKEFEEIGEKFRDSAFPVTLEFSYQTDKTQNYITTSKGLSKREYFAGLAMQGLCSDYSTINATELSADEDVAVVFGEVAVEMADALIEALNKEGSDE